MGIHEVLLDNVNELKKLGCFSRNWKQRCVLIRHTMKTNSVYTLAHEDKFELIQIYVAIVVKLEWSRFSKKGV